MKIQRTIAVWIFLALGLILMMCKQCGFSIISFLASEVLAFGHDDGR